MNIWRKLVVFIESGNAHSDRKVSCANCHQPDKAFTDNLPLAQGVYGKYGTRNTPSLLNAADAAPFFWDGRRQTLESQVLEPFFNPQEHGLKDERELLRIIRSDNDYRRVFKTVFMRDGDDIIDAAKIRSALAAYLRSLPGNNSRFDRFLAGAEFGTLSERERRGNCAVHA